MKFRRRFATGGALAGLMRALRAAWARVSPARSPGTRPPSPVSPGATRPSSGHVVETAAPAGRAGSAEERTPFDRVVAWWRFERRRAITVLGVFVGTLLLGYGLAATLLFPAPIIAKSRSIPRVLGAAEQQARDDLRAAGFGIGTVDRVSHPTVPAGAVVWQDPPPDVVAPEATDVALTLSTGPQRIPVPDVAGYDADDARALLAGAGLRVGSTESTQAPTPRNVAVNTRPPAGTTLPPGTEVVLVVSVGAATIRVPALMGLTVDEARLALETAGLALGTSFAQTTTAAAPGEIFYQEPSAGTLSAPGTAVNVRISRSR
jgi:eukaryotic-like serine/threonine-protein kinase